MHLAITNVSSRLPRARRWSRVVLALASGQAFESARLFMKTRISSTYMLNRI